MRKSSYIFILFAVLSCAAFGQYRSETLRKADILYQNHKIYEAIDLYVEAVAETPHFQEIVYQVASLYKSNFALVQAEKWYEEVLKFKKQDYVLAKFEYAIVLKQLGKYEKAIVNFEEFIKYYRGNDKSDLSKVVEKLITGCDRAMMSEKDDSFEVLNLSRANSIYSDLAPYLYQDTLYFSSIKTDTALTYIDDIGIKFQMSLQKTAFNLMEDTAKGNVMPFGPSLAIGDNSHVANATFTKDGQTMFFTKCITNLEFKNHCDLYGSKLKVGKWETPIKLGPTVNDKTGLTSSTHPSVAAHRKKNKNVLYFSSNRIGGQGGYDLWTVDIDENFVCSMAKNLGKKINTAADDITPSYNEEKQILYFSSNGHIGFGGFDIYKVKKKGRKFNAPSALKGPFNTSSDELYFQNLGNNKYLLVSNRNGAKIYHKDCVLDDMFIIRKKQRKKYLIAKLYVKDSLLTEVDSSTLQMISIDSSTVIKTNVAIRVYPGKDYTLSTNINDFINDSKTVSITKTSPDTLLVQLTIEKVEEEKEIQLKNIYFAFNSAELNDNSKLEIDQLLTILNNNPKFKIELGAHTDDIGKDEANQSLSQDRAESVVNYLVSEGIRIERLVPKGYGESKPIAPNKNKDGSDNPEGRQLNRRIVFKIIGEVEVYQSSAPIQMIQTNDSAYTDTIVQEPELIDSPKDTIQKISNDTAVKTSTDSIFTKTAAAADLPNTVEKPDSINLTNKDTVLLPITKAPIILDDSLKNNHKVSTKTVVKNVLTSQPEDASAIKGKVRWLNRPAAQRISCKSTISIQSLRVMAKEKTGVTFKVRVVKASNGKTIHESEDFNLEPNKNVSAKLMKLFDVEINCKLEKGSYFIFPIVTKGSLAFMPRYTKENSFENGKIVVHKAMYTSYTTEKPIKYKFETKEEKKNTYVNYGPFLKMEFFDPSAPVQITEINDSLPIDTIVTKTEMVESPKKTIEYISNDTIVKISIDTVLTRASKPDLLNPIKKPLTKQFTKEKTYYSSPKDVSVTNDNFRWIEHPIAQKITVKTNTKIKSLRVIAQKKTGVVFSVKVVDATTGNTVFETDDQNFPSSSSAPAWMMKYFDVKVNVDLLPGSYFIFPVIKKGNIAYLPNFSKENNFNNEFTIHKGMYINYNKTSPWKYQFDESKTASKHYGPFLKYEIEISSKEIISIDTIAQPESRLSKDTTIPDNINTTDTKTDSLSIINESPKLGKLVQPHPTLLKDSTHVKNNNVNIDSISLNTVSPNLDTVTQYQTAPLKDKIYIENIDINNTKTDSSSFNNVRPKTSFSTETVLLLNDTVYKIQIGDFKNKIDVPAFKNIGLVYVNKTSFGFYKYTTKAHASYDGAQIAKKKQTFSIY